MADREKVIRRIECILNENEMDDGFYLPVLDTVEALQDALSLLKAQEPIKPKDEQREYEAAIEMMEHNIQYEPTYNPEDGSM